MHGLMFAAAFCVHSLTHLSVTGLSPCMSMNQSFAVYFEPGTDSFSSDPASEVFDQVQRNIAVTSQACMSVSAQIDGFTDTYASQEESLMISTRRALVVQAELQSRGISPEVFVTAGHGETRLAVPTADGVRELLNERVEVLIEVGLVDTSNGMSSAPEH